MTTPKELAEEGLREQLAEALLSYYGTNNVHPDDMSDVDDLVGIMLPIIEARDKIRAEEFRRLASAANQRRALLGLDPGGDRSAGEAAAFYRAAQMVEERLNG